MGTTAVLSSEGLTKEETSEQKPGSGEGVSHEDVRALGHSLPDLGGFVYPWQEVGRVCWLEQQGTVVAEESKAWIVAQEDIQVGVAGSV